MEAELRESSCSNDTTEQTQTLLLAYGATGVGSVATCSVAVLIVLCSNPPLYKLLTYRLALYQVIASLTLGACEGLALLQLYSRVSQIDLVCIASGFLLEYCLWMKLLFVVCLTFHLFCFAVLTKNLRKLEPFYIAISTIFPVVPACIPLATSSYGTAGVWCWIPDEKVSQNCTTESYKTGLIEQYALWLGPVTVALALDNIAVIAMFVTLLCRACNRKRRSGDESRYLLGLSQRLDPNKEAFRQMLPLLAYPVIFFSLNLMPLVRRIYEVSAHKNSFVMALLHAILGPSWGFFAGLALITHVCLIRRCENKQRKTMNFGGTPPVNSTHPTWQQSAPCGNVSSSAVTRYIIPRESEVDEEKLAKQLKE